MLFLDKKFIFAGYECKSIKISNYVQICFNIKSFSDKEKSFTFMEAAGFSSVSALSALFSRFLSDFMRELQLHLQLLVDTTCTACWGFISDGEPDYEFLLISTGMKPVVFGLGRADDRSSL